MTNQLNEIGNFEYKQLTISSFLIGINHENRLQKQKADVVRRDDTEGSGRFTGNFPVLYFPVGKTDHAETEERNIASNQRCLSFLLATCEEICYIRYRIISI